MTALDVTTPQQHSWDRPQPVLWLQVLAARGRLDRLLADGRSPATDARLALRARQLAQPAARTRLAAALYDAVQSIDEDPFARCRQPALEVNAPSVRACAGEIRDLAGALMEPHPRARGIVMARRLLTDGSSPLYAAGQSDQLRARIVGARSAL